MAIARDNKTQQFYITFKWKDKNGKYHTKNIRNPEWKMKVGIRYMKSIQDSIISEEKRKLESGMRYNQDITLEKALDVYYRVREADGYSINTLEVQEYILKNIFKEYLNKNVMVSSIIGMELADKIKIALGNSNKSVSSKNHQITVVKSFIQFIRKRGFASRDNCDDMLDLLEPMKGTTNRKQNFFVHGEEDLRKFEATFVDNDQEYYIPIMTIFYGALRIGEWQALRVKDFNLANCTLSITKQLNIHCVQINHTKNKTDRLVYLPKKFADMLQEFIDTRKLQDNEILFQNSVGRPFHRSTIDSVLKRHLKEAGLEHMTLHGLRHSFATRMFDKGYDVKEVQEQLGHKDMNTTMSFYIHYTQDKKKHNMDDLM